MLGVQIGPAKSLFFDRPAVRNAVDRAQRRVLSRFGAYVRRGARSSIRKRKRPAPPGSPPSDHTGRLKRNIFFVYEPVKSSVVIGPARLSGSTDAPETLEHGGVVTLKRRGRRIRKRYQALRTRARCDADRSLHPGSQAAGLRMLRGNGARQTALGTQSRRRPHSGSRS